MFSHTYKANYKLAEGIKINFFCFLYVYTTNEIQAHTCSVFTDDFHLFGAPLSELCEVLVARKIPHSQQWDCHTGFARTMLIKVISARDLP